MTLLAEQILKCYDARACWICGKPGLCAHREGRVEAAEIEAREARAAKGQQSVLGLTTWPAAFPSGGNPRKPLGMSQFSGGGVK